MRPDRMTTKSREAFNEGLDRAARAGHPELHPEHVLQAMLAQADGVAGPLLQKTGVDLRAFSHMLAARLDTLPRVSGGSPPGLSRRSMDLIRGADDEAKALKD